MILLFQSSFSLFVFFRRQQHEGNLIIRDTHTSLISLREERKRLSLICDSIRLRKSGTDVILFAAGWLKREFEFYFSLSLCLFVWWSYHRHTFLIPDPSQLSTHSEILDREWKRKRLSNQWEWEGEIVSTGIAFSFENPLFPDLTILSFFSPLTFVINRWLTCFSLPPVHVSTHGTLANTHIHALRLRIDTNSDAWTWWGVIKRKAGT